MGGAGLRDCLLQAIIVGKTRPNAQIIQLTMPIAQFPIPNFIFLMALALILVYLQLKVGGEDA
jgi:hypothetical protein